ncbi:MAG: DsbA family protein [Actinomycetes bacterium]
MTDLEFFFDPVCPWAWITSRWVVEVQSLRSYEVRWRFISLKLINATNAAEWYGDQYKRWHAMGHEALRVSAAIEGAFGNVRVGDFYTAIGTQTHNMKRRDDFAASSESFISEALVAAKFSEAEVKSLIGAAFDESFDERIASDTDLAFSRTGKDVGTPILTFRPGRDDEGSFFGPVISRIPRGPEALTLWDAVEIVATTPGVVELKRTLRSAPIFD